MYTKDTIIRRPPLGWLERRRFYRRLFEEARLKNEEHLKDEEHLKVPRLDEND